MVILYIITVAFILPGIITAPVDLHTKTQNRGDDKVNVSDSNSTTGGGDHYPSDAVTTDSLSTIIEETPYLDDSITTAVPDIITEAAVPGLSEQHNASADNTYNNANRVTTRRTVRYHYSTTQKNQTSTTVDVGITEDKTTSGRMSFTSKQLTESTKPYGYTSTSPLPEDSIISNANEILKTSASSTVSFATTVQTTRSDESEVISTKRSTSSNPLLTDSWTSEDEETTQSSTEKQVETERATVAEHKTKVDNTTTPITSTKVSDTTSETTSTTPSTTTTTTTTDKPIIITSQTITDKPVTQKITTPTTATEEPVKQETTTTTTTTSKPTFQRITTLQTTTEKPIIIPRINTSVATSSTISVLSSLSTLTSISTRKITSQPVTKATTKPSTTVSPFPSSTLSPSSARTTLGPTSTIPATSSLQSTSQPTTRGRIKPVQVNATTTNGTVKFTQKLTTISSTTWVLKTKGKNTTTLNPFARNKPAFKLDKLGRTTEKTASGVIAKNIQDTIIPKSDKAKTKQGKLKNNILWNKTLLPVKKISRKKQENEILVKNKVGDPDYDDFQGNELYLWEYINEFHIPKEKTWSGYNDL